MLWGFLGVSGVRGGGWCVEGKKVQRCAMVCMPVIKKGMYCVVNVVIV